MNLGARKKPCRIKVEPALAFRAEVIIRKAVLNILKSRDRNHKGAVFSHAQLDSSHKK